MQANSEVRRFAKAEGVPLWRLAEALEISEPTMTRRLRHELPSGEKEQILAVVERLKGGSNNRTKFDV